MTTVEVFAPAKINLTLHVTGQRDDGYHFLDSLVVFASVGDRLTLTDSGVAGLSVTGPFAPDVPTGPDNLVMRAAALLGAGAHIHLEKNLPVASGIGGGSADAAAVVRGLARLYGLPIPKTSTLIGLGADVPVCMISQPVRMTGVGENLARVRGGAVRLPMVLVNPMVPLSTPEVFRRLARKDNAPMEDLGSWPDTTLGIANWLSRQRNDLQDPARAVAPVISDVLDALSATKGCLLTRMSGSGATCFGIFSEDDLAEAAARDLEGRFTGWWIKQSLASL